MNRIQLVLCALGIFVVVASTADQPAKPNIIVFLVDDLGWAQPGWLGEKESSPPPPTWTPWPATACASPLATFSVKPEWQLDGLNLLPILEGKVARLDCETLHGQGSI